MDPHRFAALRDDLVGVLVGHPHPHVLEEGEHIGEGDGPAGLEQLEAQEPVRCLEGMGEAEGDAPRGAAPQRLDAADIGDRHPGGEVLPVAGREGGAEAADEGDAPLLAVGFEERLGEVVRPRAGRLGQAGLDQLQVGRRPGVGAGVDQEVEPGQHRLAHLGRVLVAGPVEGGDQDVGHPVADGLRVAVERHEHQAAPVPPEAVPPGEEPHPLALLEGEDPEGRVVELVSGDLEQLQAGQGLEDGHEGAAVVGGGGEPGPLEDRRHFGADDGDGRRRRPVDRRRVQAEEPVLADHPAGGLATADADVVEGGGPVDGRPGAGPGQD